jgi:hypothetical protein
LQLSKINKHKRSQFNETINHQSQQATSLPLRQQRTNARYGRGIAMITTIIKEGALNDDVLYLAGYGKLFTGNYVAILEYYTFASEWGNQCHYRRFRTLANADNFIAKKYKEVTPCTTIKQA